MVLLVLPTGPCSNSTRRSMPYLGRALKDVDDLHQGAREAEDGVAAVVVGVIEEPVADQAVLASLDRGDAVRQDHVVQAPVGTARDTRVGPDDVEIFVKRPVPVFLAVTLEVLRLRDAFEDTRASPTKPLLVSPLTLQFYGGRLGSRTGPGHDRAA